jgi:emfourin
VRVQFTQSGGFVGAIRECTLDTSSMQADEATTLETLVKNANLFSTPGEQRSLTGRDLEDYQISIDDGHGDVTVVRDQSTLTAEAKALVAYLKKCAKPARLK